MVGGVGSPFAERTPPSHPLVCLRTHLTKASDPDARMQIMTERQRGFDWGSK